MLASLKAEGAVRAPRLFALASIPADWWAAANPASELNLLPLLVKRGETACDIGANRGLFTYWLLRLGAKVTAFEPNPDMVRILEYRFRRAISEGRLALHGHALGDVDDEAVLHVPHDHAPLATLDGALIGIREEVHEVPVRRRRLDDCVSGIVDFIKIDVEGHEARVLAGAPRVLTSHHPTLLVEAEERHRAGALALLRQMLEPLGYEGFFALADGMHPVDAFDPDIHQRPEGLNEEGTAARAPFGYVNNFVFTARARVRSDLLSWVPGRVSLRSAA